MAPDELKHYVEEVHRQWRFAAVAAHEYNVFLQRLHEFPEMHAASQDRIYLSLQGLLTAAAQISKMLYPIIDKRWPEAQKTFAKQRGLTLREVLETGHDSLLKRRYVRDAVEHFDERLDRVLLERRTGDYPVAIVDILMGPRDAIYSGNTETRFLRTLDPERGEFALLDASVSLDSLYQEVARVGEAAEKWIKEHDPHWLS